MTLVFFGSLRKLAPDPGLHPVLPAAMRALLSPGRPATRSVPNAEQVVDRVVQRFVGKLPKATRVLWIKRS